MSVNGCCDLLRECGDEGGEMRRVRTGPIWLRIGAVDSGIKLSVQGFKL